MFPDISQVPTAYIIANVFAFAEAALILASASIFVKVSGRLGGKAAGKVSAFFLYGAGAYFLYKLVFFMINFFEYPARSHYLDVAGASILFCSGLLFLKAANGFSAGVARNAA